MWVCSSTDVESSTAFVSCSTACVDWLVVHAYMLLMMVHLLLDTVLPERAYTDVHIEG